VRASGPAGRGPVHEGPSLGATFHQSMTGLGWGIECKNRDSDTGYVAGGSSPEELETLLKSEIAKWSAVIKLVGIKID
jgi:hypothetical protein